MTPKAVASRARCKSCCYTGRIVEQIIRFANHELEPRNGVAFNRRQSFCAPVGFHFLHGKWRFLAGSFAYRISDSLRAGFSPGASSVKNTCWVNSARSRPVGLLSKNYTLPATAVCETLRPRTIARYQAPAGQLPHPPQAIVSAGFGRHLPASHARASGAITTIGKKCGRAATASPRKMEPTHASCTRVPDASTKPVPTLRARAMAPHRAHPRA